jgi:hypothetical protein
VDWHRFDVNPDPDLEWRQNLYSYSDPDRHPNDAIHNTGTRYRHNVPIVLNTSLNQSKVIR